MEARGISHQLHVKLQTSAVTLGSRTSQVKWDKRRKQDFVQKEEQERNSKCITQEDSGLFFSRLAALGGCWIKPQVITFITIVSPSQMRQQVKKFCDFLNQIVTGHMSAFNAIFHKLLNFSRLYMKQFWLLCLRVSYQTSCFLRWENINIVHTVCPFRVRPHTVVYGVSLLFCVSGGLVTTFWPASGLIVLNLFQISSGGSRDKCALHSCRKFTETHR